jgi:hypothetical protein
MASWQRYLRHLIGQAPPPDRSADDVRRFLRETAAPALRAVRDELDGYGASHARLLTGGGGNDAAEEGAAEGDHVTLVLRHDAPGGAAGGAQGNGQTSRGGGRGAEVRYTVRLRSFLEPSAGFPEPPSGDDAREYVAEVRVGERRRHGDVVGWSQDALIRDVLSALDQALTWPDVPSRSAPTSS